MTAASDPLPPDPPPTVTAGPAEPVVSAHIGTAIAYIAAITGWAVFPDQATINLYVSGAAVVLGFLLTVYARSRVTPTGRVTLDSLRATAVAMVGDEVEKVLNQALAARGLDPNQPTVAQLVGPLPPMVAAHLAATPRWLGPTSPPPAAQPEGLDTTSEGGRHALR